VITLAAGTGDLSSDTSIPVWVILVAVLLLYLAVKK
jgi:hypothetical protein